MHKNLDIWKLGINLVIKIYETTLTFPSSEQFGLSSHMQRAAVSIPSNIAEGAAHNSIKEYIQFLFISLSSLSELETQLMIANRLDYFHNSTIFVNIEKLRRKLLNFIKYVKEKC
ncbi:MAG TPA: four helix bundle protein [Candidatus Cloacimonetes bacterium]|nr:four helix bundle protein [Candidatus Cloacimonadota bacterium]HEX37504.1 four helix bundle protein [Candidatus Cloacimonadota bacterium]